MRGLLQDVHGRTQLRLEFLVLGFSIAGLATVGQEELGLQLAGDWKLDVLRRGFLEVGGEGCDSRQSVIGLTR
jgi:hypothetical protein